MEVNRTPSGCYSIVGAGEHTHAGVGIRIRAAAELTEGETPHRAALRQTPHRAVPDGFPLKAHLLLCGASSSPPHLRVSSCHPVSLHARVGALLVLSGVP